MIQSAMQLTEGLIQGIRKLSVFEGQEAGRLLVSSVKSGAKTIGAEGKVIIDNVRGIDNQGKDNIEPQYSKHSGTGMFKTDNAEAISQSNAGH